MLAPAPFSPRGSGKGKKDSQGLVRGGQQIWRRGCPELTHGAADNSLVCLTENSSVMSQNGYFEDAGVCLSGVGMCRELLGQKALGDLVHPPG